MSNKVRIPPKASYLQYPKGFAVGRRPLVTEDNMLNFLNLPEKTRYLVRVYIRFLEAVFCQGAPRRPSNKYLAKKLGRHERHVQRYLQAFRRLGLLRDRSIHYAGCMKRGRPVPRNTYRYLFPRFTFGAPRKSNASPTQQEWYAFFRKVCDYVGGTDLYRIEGRAVLLPGGKHLIKDLESGMVIRQSEDTDLVFSRWFTLPDGKVVHMDTWNGQ